jgi:flavin-dependent dehydrogenase
VSVLFRKVEFDEISCAEHSRAGLKRRIAIIGAGPGGTALGLELVAQGVDPADIVLIDKARFPRPKLCGGGITWRGTEWLERVLGRRPTGGATTSRLEFRSELGTVFVRERGPQWVYDRGELDHILLEACRDRGIEVRQETSVSALEPGIEGFRVRHGKNVTQTFEWVVGADGAGGLSRRASGLRGGLTGRLVEAVFEPESADARKDTLVFDFDPILDGIPGYAWIFPYPDPCGHSGRFKIGVMDGRGVVPGDVLRRWTMEYAARSGFRLVDSKVHGWPERYFDADVVGHRPGLILVGEALGIDALLGEGIAPSLFIASYAARRLRAALDERSSKIAGYESGFLATQEGRNLWFQARLADRLYGPNRLRWLRVLFGMSRLAELAESGNDAYGRLAKRIPTLLAHSAWDFARRGMPSAEPFTRRSVAESRDVQ